MKKYKLTTIKDIFDQVPVDRLDVLFSELKALMLHCDFVRGLEEVKYTEFPKSITWVDDGKGEVEVRVHTLDKDEFVGSIKSTVREL